MGWRRSPSQLTLYERCPKAWEYAYVKKIKVQAAWAIRGRAVHAALARYYQAKLAGHGVLSVEEVVEQFQAEVTSAFGMRAHAEPVVLFGGESEERIRAEGEAALTVYLRDLAPTITPIAVEQPIEMVLPSGLRLTGIVDLIDDRLRIRDTKVVADRMDPATLHYQAQPPLYAALYHAQFGTYPEVVFDVVRLGRGKTPKAVAESITLQTTEALVAARLRDLEMVDQAITAGLFPRRPSEMNCSKCVFKHACWWTLLPTQPGDAGQPDPDLTPVLEASITAAQAAKTEA
jgi:RecB family exonuclease